MKKNQHAWSLNPTQKNKLARYAEKKSFGEVFTPIWFIEKIFSDLEKYDVHIWSNPQQTFFDFAAGNGDFLKIIYEKLMIGLMKNIPDENERKMHIKMTMIFGCELNLENAQECLKIFPNIFNGDALNPQDEPSWFHQKFTYIIGNPPFNGNFKSIYAKASSIYIDFVKNYINRCEKMCLILPAKWFCIQRPFRTFMFGRNDIVFLKYFSNPKHIFGQNVYIDGNICYFFKNENHNNYFQYFHDELPVHHLITDNYDFIYGNYISLWEKIHKGKNVRTLSELYLPQNYFGVSGNDGRLRKNKENGDIILHVSEQHHSDTQGKLYGDPQELKIFENKLKKHIVITTSSYHDHLHGFGYVRICEPNQAYTISFIGFSVDNIVEAQSLKSFMETKFCTAFILMKKITKNIREETTSLIPLPPLDRIWEDNELCAYFGLDDNDKSFISRCPLHSSKK